LPPERAVDHDEEVMIASTENRICVSVFVAGSEVGLRVALPRPLEQACYFCFVGLIGDFSL